MYYGNITGQSIISPTETPFTSLHDVFACFSTPSVSWKPMEVDLDAGEKITDSLKLAFDDSVSTVMFCNKMLIDFRKAMLYASHIFTDPPPPPAFSPLYSTLQNTSKLNLVYISESTEKLLKKQSRQRKGINCEIIPEDKDERKCGKRNVLDSMV